MSRSEKEFAELFNSLRPESLDNRDASRAAAREATLRWPMLRSLLPTTTSTLPALTEHELETRMAIRTTQIATAKRALSLPSPGNKLEQSLAKMAARAQAHALPAATSAAYHSADSVADGAAPADSMLPNNRRITAAKTGKNGTQTTSPKPQRR